MTPPEHGSKDRACHDRGSPDRQHPAVILLRVDIEEDRLCELDPAAQTFFELRQGHIGNRRVERLHGGRDHQRRRRLPPARTR